MLYKEKDSQSDGSYGMVRVACQFSFHRSSLSRQNRIFTSDFSYWMFYFTVHWRETTVHLLWAFGNLIPNGSPARLMLSTPASLKLDKLILVKMIFDPCSNSCKVLMVYLRPTWKRFSIRVEGTKYSQYRVSSMRS